MKIEIDIPQSYIGNGRKGTTGSLDPVRDTLIVRRIALGETLQSIGNDLGISRERVRQIYKKYTHRGARERYLKNMLTKVAKLNQVKFTCKSCNRKITFAEGANRQIYCVNCLPRKANDGNKLVKIQTLTCSGCGKSYHPRYQSLRKTVSINMGTQIDERYSGRSYHSRKCFYKNAWGKNAPRRKTSKTI